MCIPLQQHKHMRLILKSADVRWQPAPLIGADSTLGLEQCNKGLHGRQKPATGQDLVVISNLHRLMQHGMHAP